MKLSVIIPVYNEHKTIKEIIKRVAKVNIKKEIIVVDDCSTDGTKELLKSVDIPGVRIFYHGSNFGKGQAVKTGLAQAEGEIVLIQDADLEYNPSDYHALIEPIVSGRTDVVYGSRWRNQGLKNVPLNIFRVGRWALTVLANFLYGVNITDEPCCYKVFKTDMIKSIPLECKGFEFCPEITAKIARRGHKIYEIPVRYNPRGIKEGKKIKWTDGLIACITLFKYRFWR